MVQISKDEIDNLASKLDELGEVLTEKEKGLLLAVFGLAATALKAPSSEAESAGINFPTQNLTMLEDFKVDLPGKLPSLSSGFRGAFQPGRAGKFKIGGIGEVADIGVGGTTVTWTA